MFNYYGSKSRLARKYPAPLYDLIIEPFAGAAHYSLAHRRKNVLLNDKYEVVYKVWSWLIDEAKPEHVLALSGMKKGDTIHDLSPEGLKMFVGFLVGQGSESPRLTMTEWGDRTWNYVVKRVTYMIPQVKHWKVRHGDYRDLPDIEATWFIDPPYQYGGDRYVESSIDFVALAEWCKSRQGQVIVCENEKADWLDFQPLANLHGQKYDTLEMIWTNEEFRTKGSSIFGPVELHKI